MRRTRLALVRRGRLLHLEPQQDGEPPGGELFQQCLRDRPFWMLVACSLVNLTTWEQARPALEWLMASYPTPGELAHAAPEDLHGALRPLGLWRRRAVSLGKLASRWCSLPGGDVMIRSLPGCGRYAADSWAIFVEGREDVEPTDAKLSWYLRTRRKEPDP